MKRRTFHKQQKHKLQQHQLGKESVYTHPSLGYTNPLITSMTILFLFKRVYFTYATFNNLPLETCH